MVKTNQKCCPDEKVLYSAKITPMRKIHRKNHHRKNQLLHARVGTAVFGPCLDGRGLWAFCLLPRLFLSKVNWLMQLKIGSLSKGAAVLWPGLFSQKCHSKTQCIYESYFCNDGNCPVLNSALLLGGQPKGTQRKKPTRFKVENQDTNTFAITTKSIHPSVFFCDLWRRGPIDCLAWPIEMNDTLQTSYCRSFHYC